MNEIYRQSTEYTASETPEIQQEPFEYQILKEHPRTDKTIKSSEQLRMEYIELTDELIQQMTDGVDVLNKDTGKFEKKIPDTVIWLDKSARPVSWLTRELWPRLAPVPGSTEVPKMPDFRYLNIDRQQWINEIDDYGNGTFDISKIDPSIIRSLRSVFVDQKYKVDPETKEPRLSPSIDTAPSSLDNKTVMIVDEVRSSGRTIDISKQLIKKAFPTAEIVGTYWMSRMHTKPDGSKGNADIPVWYDEKVEGGRLVGNRSNNVSGRESENITQRLGAWFLSSRFPSVDQSALQLKREFHQLATNPDVPIMPSIQRDDYDERAAAYNGVPIEDVDAVYATMRAIKGIKRAR